MEEKREPLSEMAIERKIQILRNKHMDSEVIALVKSDYEYGLTDDEIGLYLNKSYDIEQMKVLSKCLHKGVSEELLTLLKDSRMAAPKMQTALDYYEKGVPIDAIREVVQKDDTAVNMRRMFDVVLEKLNKAKEQMPQDLEYVKSLVAQMDEVVEKINHQNERYDALNKKLSEIETSKDDEEVRERLVKENQDKDALINSQQNELNKASGETKGRQGSSSRNYDVLGRELFTPDEVRKLDNKKCIIFIRGFDPIMDNKFIPFNHPMFNQTADGKGKPYVHQIRGTDNLIGPPFEILSDKAVKYYEKLKDKGENVYIDSLTYEQFMMLGDAELSRRFSMQDEAEQKAKIDREQANELEYVDESQKSEATESANASSGSAGAKPVRNPEREKPKWEDTITNRMLHWSYTPEQKEEVKKALAAGVPKSTILTYFYPEVTVEKMSSYRKKQ